MKPAHVADNEDQTEKNMDNMYRWTRHVYDASRKYYLLGRDDMIDNLRPKDGELICEVGCGTARNLIKMAQKYPKAKFFGLDASNVMLETAEENLRKVKLHKDVLLRQALSQSFGPCELFGIQKPLNKIVFSYALSIIPPWKESLDHALKLLPSGGEIHIVDFGGQDQLPLPFRKALFWWLEVFHVYYKPEIIDYLKQLESENKGTLEFETLFKGYAYRAVFRRS